MGVYIKGMEMPKNCWNCPFFHTSLHNIGDDELLGKYTCLRTGERTDQNVTGYMKNCPLIELPPHGDLIDRGYAIATACSGRIRTLPTTEDGENWIRVEEVRESIKNAPTVVPAEEADT